MNAHELHAELKKILPIYDYHIDTKYPQGYQFWVTVSTWVKEICNFSVNKNTTDLTKTLLYMVINLSTELEKKYQQIREQNERERVTTNKIIEALWVELATYED